MTSSGIEPATFRFVAHCHRGPPVMILYLIYFKVKTCFGPYSGPSSGHD